MGIEREKIHSVLRSVLSQLCGEVERCGGWHVPGEGGGEARTEKMTSWLERTSAGGQAARRAQQYGPASRSSKTNSIRYDTTHRIAKPCYY